MKRVKYLLLVPLCVIVFFIFNSKDEVRDEKIKELFIEYPPIDKIGKDYNGIVRNYMIGSQYTTGEGMYVELSNGDKFLIFGTSLNSKYKKPDLRDNLRINDSIYYNSKTGEIFIYRGKECLYFKFFKSI